MSSVPVDPHPGVPGSRWAPAPDGAPIEVGPAAGHFTKLTVDDLDLASFATRPLHPRTLRALRYLFDVSRATIGFLRDVLVTATHKDARVTAFLSRWAFEEFWCSEALSRVLDAHGVGLDTAHIRAMRATLGWRDDLSPVHRSIVANVVGQDITAAHMVWGVANEWCVREAYDRVGELDDHPILHELLDRMRPLQVRHAEFYAAESHARLATSPRARRVTRLAFRTLWGPIGTTIHPRAESALVLSYLWSGPRQAERIEAIDARLRGLPGLGGLSVLRRALGRYGVGPDAGRRASLAERLRYAPSERSWRGLLGG